MVIDDIEVDTDSSFVERGNQFLKFSVPAIRIIRITGVGAFRSKEGLRIISPVILVKDRFVIDRLKIPDRP